MSIKASGFVLIVICQSVSGQVVIPEGNDVSFCPESFSEPISSLKWTHTDVTGTINVIEWDPEDDPPLSIPNPRFQQITSLNLTTGEITITSVTMQHIGEYVFELNSEEKQVFTLDVLKAEMVPSSTDWLILLGFFIIFVLIAGYASCRIWRVC